MTTDRAKLLRRGLSLEYVTLGWNVVGVVVLAFAALPARSLALAGFGADSLIEILASAVVVWQLKGDGRGRERIALRVIAAAFVLLAVYIVAQAAYVFRGNARPEPSAPGMAWLAVTVVVMVGLAAGKRATGRALELRAPTADTLAPVSTGARRRGGIGFSFSRKGRMGHSVYSAAAAAMAPRARARSTSGLR